MLPIRPALCLIGILSSALLAGPGDYCPDCAARKSSPQSPEVKLKIQQDVKALKPVHVYIGKWRGAGYPKQGSGEGAWGEQADWAYDFDEGRGALVMYLTDGKFFKQASLTPGDSEGVFVLKGQTPDGKSPGATETFTGTVNKDGELVLSNPKAKDGSDRPAKITIRIVAHGDRMVILYERFDKTGERLIRMGEVGYTRKGSGFGAGGSSLSECVVTGGNASSSYTYNGKAYPVCCSGCRDMMAQDPEGVLRDYKIRKEQEKKDANE